MPERRDGRCPNFRWGTALVRSGQHFLTAGGEAPRSAAGLGSGPRDWCQRPAVIRTLRRPRPADHGLPGAGARCRTPPGRAAGRRDRRRARTRCCDPGTSPSARPRFRSSRSWWETADCSIATSSDSSPTVAGRAAAAPGSSAGTASPRPASWLRQTLQSARLGPMPPTHAPSHVASSVAALAVTMTGCTGPSASPSAV
jgi:hypothetical protein